MIYFLISFILDFNSLTGSFCKYSKYYILARCFCDLNKMYIRYDFFNPVVSILHNWANFFKVLHDHLISFKSFCEISSFLNRLDSFNFFSSFSSLMICSFCLFCRFLYISSFKFFNSYDGICIYPLLCWLVSFYESL